MNILENLTIRQLLDPLPRRICTYFASQCAKDAIQRSGTKYPVVLLAQDVAERYGNGEDFDEAYLKEVANKASAYAYAAHSAAASAAASAAYYSAYSVYSAYASAATSAASAASAAARAYYEVNYKPLLLKILNERLTPLEFMLYFGEDNKKETAACQNLKSSVKSFKTTLKTLMKKALLWSKRKS